MSSTATAAIVSRTFAGKFPFEGAPSIYNWLNPAELENDIRAKYDPARLLVTFIETDEEAYWYWLNMMPPRDWQRDAFTMCEASTGDIRLAFFKMGDRYFAAYVRDARDSAHHFLNVRSHILENMPAAG